MDLNGKPIADKIPEDLETRTITAEEEFKLLGKYILPTTKPALNNVILAGAGVGPAGEVICEWGVELGGGDVVGPPGAVDNNLCAFNGTSGKTIKDSGILISNVIANPVSTNVNMNGNSIQNSLTIAGRALVVNDNTNTPQYGFAYNPLLNKLELKDTDGDLIFDVNKATNVTTYSGNLNVNNLSAPFSKFDIGGTSYLHLRADDSNFGPGFSGRKARGSFTSPTPALQGDTCTFLRGDGYNGFSYNLLGQINIVANENQNISSKGGRIEVQTSDNGNNSPTTKMTIDSEVKVEGGMIVHNSSNLSKYDFNETQLAFYRGDNQPFGAQIAALKSRGSLSAPTPVLLDDTILNLRGLAYNGINYNIPCDILMKANENQGLSNNGGKILFDTSDLGDNVPTTKMTIDNQVKIENDLVIGNSTPGTSYTLPSVRGTAGQVLKDVSGNGIVTWETELASSETLQQAYDASPAYPASQIETDVSSAVISFKSHLPNSVSQRFFELKEVSGQEVFEVYSDGYLYGYSGLSLGGGPGLNAYNFPITAGPTESHLRLVGNNVVFSWSGYSQQGAVAVPTNNTNENVITSSGAGSLTIPAGTIRAGTILHFVMNGAMRNQNSSANVRIRVKSNGIIIGDTNIVSLDAIASLSAFELEIDFRFSTGGTSIAPTQLAQFTYFDNGYKGGMRSSTLLPIDTTIDNTISATWEWQTASFDNEAFVRMLRITKEF